MISNADRQPLRLNDFAPCREAQDGHFGTTAGYLGPGFLRDTNSSLSRKRKENQK